MRLLIIGIILVFSSTVQAQHSNSLFDLLMGEEVREVTLKTDLVKLLANAEQEPEYQAAIFSFVSEQGEAQDWDIKVKVRGKFRRQVCDFPPLKLNFSKTALTNQGLAEHDKLKLVTHCLEDKSEGQENVLQEYLAYKLYQELTPNSFRVQLVKIVYLDTSGRISGITRYGFLIESTNELEERINGTECEECTYQAVSAFDEQASRTHAMFQYLIGNADYSLPVLRNVKLIRRKTDGKLVPVGYDFDFAGFVDAPYALPSNHLGQIAIRQRIYLGTQSHDEELQETMKLYLAKQDRLLSIIEDFSLLTTTQRYELKEYLLTFYDQIGIIKAGGYQNVYPQLRQEHPQAIPDGGLASDYGIGSGNE